MSSSVLRSFVLALAAVSFFSVGCSAAPAPEVPSEDSAVAPLGTNAQRLAAGLNPATPKNLIRHRSIDERDDESEMLSAQPLPCANGVRSGTNLKRAAGQTYSGIICVHYPGNDTLVGYVSRSFIPDGYYTISRDPNMALEVSFKAGHWRHFDFRISTPQDDDLPFLGAIASSYNATAAGLGSNRAHLGFTSRTPMMSPPMPMAQISSDSYSSSQTPMSEGAHSIRAYESAIWNFDFSTAQLTPTWVNPGGKVVEKATTVHDREEGTFAITAVENVEEAVNFYFEPSA